MANVGEMASYAGAGAGIGSAFGPIGTGVGAGVGALVGGLKGWYDRNKAGKERRWQESELLRQYNALEALANIQSMGQQDLINKQLGIEQKNLVSTFATSGGIRTGNYQRKVGELNVQAVTDVANVARTNALQAKMMEMGYTQQVNNFNLELAKLESAKLAGDADMAEIAGVNLATPIYDFISKLGNKGGETPVVNQETFGPELPVSSPKTMDNLTPSDYGINNPATGVNSTMDWISNLGKKKPVTADSYQLLWGD